MSLPLDPLDENTDDFVRACVHGEFEEVKAKIETSDGNNRRKLFAAKDPDYGRNSLHWAVYHCDIEAIKYLITFKELDIYSTDNAGETVFIRVLKPGPAVLYTTINDYVVRSPKPTISMLKILLEADADKHFITFNNERGSTPLTIAMDFQSIEVIKFLIQWGCDVNHVDRLGRDPGWNALHAAACCKRIDVIRFLLEETTCDRLLKDNWGYVPCCLFMRRVTCSSAITNVRKEIDFCIEFLSLTFKSPDKCYEVHLLLFQCIGRMNRPNRNAHISEICQTFAKFLIANSPDKCLADLVEQLCDEKYLTLVSLLMYENLLCHFDDDRKGSQCYNTIIQSADTLLEELFNLFLVNEQLTNEFVKRIAKTKFAYFIIKKLRMDMPWDEEQVPLQTIYNFGKMLLRNGVYVFEKCGRVYTRNQRQNQKRWKCLLQAIVPLCNYVRVPLELAFHIDHARSVRNFNESEFWMKDYHICEKGEELSRGVVSLKNLTRTTIREHLFQNGNVYEKLLAVHSMELPIEVINFICYNDYNLKL